MKEKLFEIKRTFFKKKYIVGLIALLVLAIGLPISVYLVKRQTQINSRAAAETANIYFLPASVELTEIIPMSEVSLMIDAKSNLLSFIRISLKFDKNKIQMVSDPATFSPYTIIIEKTSAAEASISGEMRLVLAVPPQASPSSGLIKIVGLSFGRLSTIPNDHTSIFVSQEDLQLVNSLEQMVNTTIGSLSVVLNPTAPTATPVPTSVPTLVPGCTSCFDGSSYWECCDSETCGQLYPDCLRSDPVPTSVPTSTPVPILITPTTIPPCSAVSGTCRTKCIGKERIQSGYLCTTPGYVCCTK